MQRFEPDSCVDAVEMPASTARETEIPRKRPRTGGVHSPQDFSDTRELTDMGREIHLAPFAVIGGKLTSRGG